MGHFDKLAVALGAALPCMPLAAQCATTWLPGNGVAGADQAIRVATTWDPDGVGPAPAKLVVGGDFTAIGSVVAEHVAMHDLTTGTWSHFGFGTAPGVQVTCMASMPNGDLVVGGWFPTAGGVPVNHVARWNGAVCLPLGLGMNGTVYALTVMPNGDVVAGGAFTTAGGAPASSIARWNGTSWTPLGSGMNSHVHALAVLPNGELVAGGDFWTAGGVSAGRIASWNGSSWLPLGTGLGANTWEVVEALVTMPSGDLVATGQFYSAGVVPMNHVARWNGISWSVLGGGLTGVSTPAARGYALAAMANGNLVVAGAFAYAGGVAANNIAQWNGAAWAPLGNGVGGLVLAATQLPNGDVVAGGSFTTAGTTGTRFLARWDTVSWSPLDAGTDAPVDSVAATANGDLVVGGSFTVIGGVPANHIARRSGLVWTPLGSGLNNRVKHVASLPNGDVIAAGPFTTAGGVPVNGIARWNGTAWSALGAGNTTVTALLALPNGDLLVGSLFPSLFGSPAWVGRWNGVAWTALGSSGPTNLVHRLIALPNGDIVARGTFTTAGGATAYGTARWNGSTWSPLGGGPGVGYAVAQLPGGDIVAGIAGGTNPVVRWDGTAWSPLGNAVSGVVHALAVAPNGDVIAGGDLVVTQGTSSWQHLARWDGASWAPVASGVNGIVRSFTTLPNGDLVAGGDFTVAGGGAAAYVAQLTSTCPATAQVHGAGCASSGGANTLAPTTLPWTGSTFRATATGLPSLALVATAIGTTPVGGVPLVLLPLPLPQPGCLLHVLPDFLDLSVTTNGTAQLDWPLPNNAVFAGLGFYLQMVVLEIDPAVNVLATTATNSLQLIIGSF